MSGFVVSTGIDEPDMGRMSKKGKADPLTSRCHLLDDSEPPQATAQVFKTILTEPLTTTDACPKS